MTPTPQRQLLTDWAQSMAPHLDVFSVSDPTPTLEPHDVLAVFDDAAAARSLLLSWERIELADQSVAFVALGHPPESSHEMARPTGVDPEGVTTHAVKQLLLGGVIGAVTCGLVLAVLVWLIAGWSGVIAGAALGGAAFGAGAGAVIAYVGRTGMSPAYRQSFVDESATALEVVMFRSPAIEHRERAIDVAATAHPVWLGGVTADGRIALFPPGDE